MQRNGDGWEVTYGMPPANKIIRVLIADDSDVVRMGLAIVLENYEDMLLVGEAHNGHEAVRLVEELRPDVVLMDLLMPQMDGITATGLIRSRHPDVGVVALTSHVDGEALKGILRAGAASFLLKNARIDEIADAIRTTHYDIA